MSATWGQPGPLTAGRQPRLCLTAPLPRCPQCRSLLDGGPVAYHCPACRHGVMAADIPAEYGSRS